MRKLALTITAVASLTLATAGCKQETATPKPIRPVLTTIVEPKLPGSAVAVGTIEPRYTTNIGFQVFGRLIARPVNVGNPVRAKCVGDVDLNQHEVRLVIDFQRRHDRPSGTGIRQWRHCRLWRKWRSHQRYTHRDRGRHKADRHPVRPICRRWIQSVQGRQWRHGYPLCANIRGACAAGGGSLKAAPPFRSSAFDGNG